MKLRKKIRRTANKNIFKNPAKEPPKCYAGVDLQLDKAEKIENIRINLKFRNSNDQNIQNEVSSILHGNFENPQAIDPVILKRIKFNCSMPTPKYDLARIGKF